MQQDAAYLGFLQNDVFYPNDVVPDPQEHHHAQR
jgi:hypothetical protein